MRFEELFKKLADILSLYNIPLMENLAPGLTREEIISKLKPYGINNEVIIELYEWRNGIKFNSDNEYIGEIDILIGFNFYPIDEAIESYEFELTSIYGCGKELFPIFSDYAGSYLYIDKDGITPILYHFDYTMPGNIESYYESLERAIETTIECYNKGAMKKGDEGYWEFDFDLVREISKELNPNCVYWQKE